MPLASNSKHTIFFAHVPKCGGSSVEDYLVRRFGGPLSIRNRRDAWAKPRRGIITSASHISATDLEYFLPANLTYSFALVRDPIERALSQYRFQTGTSKTSRLSFSAWLNVMIRCARMDPRVYENHIRPQSDLVPADTEFFRLEEGFDSLIARLDEVTGTKCPEIEVGHFLNRKTSMAEIRPSRQDIQLLQEFYAVDFDRFGYDRRDLSEYKTDPLAKLRRGIAWLLAVGIVWRQRLRWLK